MDKMIRIRFGKNIRKYRALLKLTQQRLAELANIEYKYLQRLEGKKPPAIKIDTISKLAKSLKTSPAKLLS